MKPKTVMLLIAMSVQNSTELWQLKRPTDGYLWWVTKL